MKRFLAILCMLAMVLGVVNPAVFAAEGYDLQIAATNAEEIIVLEADASNVTIERDTIIDLNGHSIDGVTVLAGTLYCMDSQTADYTVADGVYGHVTNVEGNLKAAEGYLQVGDSFHAVNLDIYAMTLRAADVGVYYKSNFAADEVVAEQVESFGVALSVVAAPNADNLDSYCGYSEFTGFEAGEGANAAGTSTLLKGIMKAANGDNKNAKNASMPVYGRAYIKTTEGYVFGETVKRSLQQQVEAIDGVWASLSDAQKAPVLAMLESYTSVMEGWNIPNILGGEAGEGAGEITVPVEVPTENGVVTETVTVEQGAVSITVPAGVKLAEGVSALTLTVTPKETSDAGLTLEESQVLMPMDVHVEGLATDNAQPLTIYLGKVMAENLNMGNYTVYHVENGKANEMTLIPVDAEFTAHNQYKYSLDGELTLYMATFSEVAVVSDEENAWNGDRTYDWYTENPNADTFFIRNADQLAGFGAIVGGMDGQVADDFAGKTVVLLDDISIGDLTSENEFVFYPIGYGNNEGTYEKSGTAIDSYLNVFRGDFDGNGNTISNFYQNTWEMKGDHYWYAAEDQHYRDGFGLFGRIEGSTIKNLTIDNFSCDSEIGTSGVIAAYADSTAEKSVTFENIAITNCNPRVYNIGNGGIAGSAGCYSEAGVKPIVLKNITVDETNTISALWGSWDVGCGGLLGRYYPDAYEGDDYGIWIDNCHVAATIDVFNDVCGNYQYYWYRYCGMVIGTVEKSTSKGAADLTGIKVTGSTVDFGDRHEYYYCEFVKNTQASYTHDYQMSRIPHSDLIFTDENGNSLVDEDEAESVTGCTHDHEARGTEVINGQEVLVENNQAIYIPFRQLFGGNGWGIDGIDQSEYPDIEISVVAKSDVKFEAIVEAGTAYTSGDVLMIGDLFAEAAENEIPVDIDNVQVFVSPVGEYSTVSGVYVADKDVWTNGTLTISGLGKAKITITDYLYCNPAEITVDIMPASGDYVLKLATESVSLGVYENGWVTADSTNNSVWTLTLEGNTVKLQDVNDVCIAPAADAKDNSIVNGEYSWSIVVNDDGTYSFKGNEDSVTLAKNPQQGKFRRYKNETVKEEGYPCRFVLMLPCNHSNCTSVVTAPTCTDEGYTTYTCTKCGYSYKSDEVEATGHKYVDGTCSCGATEVINGYVLTDLANIEADDIVVITMTKGNTVYALSSANGTSSAPTATRVAVTDKKITSEVQETLKWNISNSNGNLTIYPNGTTAKWLYCTSSNNGVRVGTNTNKVFTVDASSGYLKHTATSRYVGVFVDNPDWRCYTSTTTNIANQTLAFYVLVCDHSYVSVETAPTCTEAGYTTKTCSKCGDVEIETGEAALGHSYDEGEVTTPATCTTDGVKTYTCTRENCGDTYTETIDAPGHSYIDGTCTTCGETETTEPVTVVETISFANTNQRVSQNVESQVWQSGGVTLTNTRNGAQSAVVGDVNPVKFYSGSKVVIECTGQITKVVFNCNTASYATALKNSIGDNASASGKVVTVTLNGTEDTLTIAKLTAQVRMDSITVTYTKQ